MNYSRHLEFCKAISTVCAQDLRTSYFANLPAYVSRGRFYNSMHTYALSNLPELLEVASETFTIFEKYELDEEKTRQSLSPLIESIQQEIQNSTNFNHRYFYKKQTLFYNQVLDHSKELISQYLDLSHEPHLPSGEFFKEHQVGFFLSFVSYIYFDLWMAPRQLFFPDKSTCSGAWSVWEEIDYFQLTEFMHANEGRQGFGSALYDHVFWKEKLDPYAMIKAMIVRMGELGNPSIPYSIVDWNIRIFLRFLGVSNYIRCDRELEFLKSHEGIFNQFLIKKFIRQ
jgi:hypothetical protein